VRLPVFGSPSAVPEENAKDLRILLAKKFIHQLNDDLVVFVTDWREHSRRTVHGQSTDGIG
jgi:hypothetical protein